MSSIITDYAEAERVENNIKYKVAEESCANCANACAKYYGDNAISSTTFCAEHRIRVDLIGVCMDFSAGAEPSQKSGGFRSRK